nr:hypothetical protein [Tanacetum cinerariifolium]
MMLIICYHPPRHTTGGVFGGLDCLHNSNIIKCTCCGEQSTKEVCLSLEEREFHTRQEPEVHLVKKMDGTPITEIDIK